MEEINTLRVTKTVREISEDDKVKYVLQKGDVKVEITSPNKLNLKYNDEVTMKLDVERRNDNLGKFEDE